MAFQPLASPLIDSHCHLVPQVYGDGVPEVIERAFAAGIERVVNIGGGDGMAGNHEVLRMNALDARLHPVVGVHPHDARLLTDHPEILDELSAMARRPEVVGFGEIGLDYYYDLSPRPAQQSALEAQLDVAMSAGKPVVIHVRDAYDDLLSILGACNAWALPVVFHCFSSDWAFARRCIDRGAFIGISGIVTFRRAEEVREVASKVPVERLLLETDSPYLAPEPFRGRRNEPALVHAVALEVARLRNMDVADLAALASDNARRLFSLPPCTRKGATRSTSVPSGE